MLVSFEDCPWMFSEPLLAPGSLCWFCAAFPPPINNPPNWEHARFSVKQSVLVPLSSMPGQSEGEGRWTELCSCPVNKMKHFRGRWEGPGCTLNQPLSSARKILRATEHPVVGYPYQQITHVYLLPPSADRWDRAGGERKESASIFPPTFSPVSSRLWARQGRLHV